MAKPAGLLMIVAILSTTVLSFCAHIASGSHELNFYYFPVSKAKADCRGSIGECLTQEEEEAEVLAVDSESHRRMLYWRRRYISYRAMLRDRVPCSRRGASYYNCRPGAPANPYYRGCSTITRCRG